MQQQIKVVPGKVYNIQIRSIYESGSKSDWSPNFVIPAQTKIAVPSAVTGLSVYYLNSTFLWNWDASGETDFAYYEYYFTSTIQTTSSAIFKITTPTISIDVDANRELWKEKQYFNSLLTIYVRVVNKSGIASNYVSISGSSAGPPAPSQAPTITSVSDGLYLTWLPSGSTGNTGNTGSTVPSSKISKYNIYVSTTTPSLADFSYADSSTTTSFLYHSTYYSQTHYIYIKAVDKGGTESATGSPIGTSTTGPLPPAIMYGLVSDFSSYSRAAGSSVATFATKSSHGLTGGDSVYIYGTINSALDTDFNSPVSVTYMSDTSFTCSPNSGTSSLTGAGGSVYTNGGTGGTAVRIKDDGILVGSMSTGQIVAISPSSINIQSSSNTANRFAITSTSINAYKGGNQTLNITSGGDVTVAGTIKSGTSSNNVTLEGNITDYTGYVSDSIKFNVSNQDPTAGFGFIHMSSSGNTSAAAYAQLNFSPPRTASGNTGHPQLYLKSRLKDGSGSSVMNLNADAFNIVSSTTTDSYPFDIYVNATNWAARFWEGGSQFAEFGDISTYDNHFTIQAYNRNLYLDTIRPSDGTHSAYPIASITIRDYLPASGATSVVIDSNGYIRKSSSSLRYKVDVRDLNISGDWIDKIRPVTYKDKSEFEEKGSDAQDRFGFIAEEVAAITELVPLAVYFGDEVETVLYDKMVPLLVLEIRKLRKRISDLENK